MKFNPFSSALFKSPKYNVFPQPNTFKGSVAIGKRYPVQYWYMDPGDSIDVNLQQLTRFAALASPVMHNLQVDFQAIEIPDRLALPINVSREALDGGFENFHNLDTAIQNSERMFMPTVTIRQLLAWYVVSSINPIGSIFDYLQYPTFSDFYRILKKQGAFEYFAFHDNDFSDISLTSTLGSSFLKISSLPNGVVYRGYSLGQDTSVPDLNVRNLLVYLLVNYPDTIPGIRTESAVITKTFKDIFVSLGVIDDSYSGAVTSALYQAAINEIISRNNITALRAIDEYSNYVFTLYLAYLLENAQGNQTDTWFTDSPKLSLLPLYAFWSAYYDWYINTNIQSDSTGSKLLWLKNKGLNFFKENYTAKYGDLIDPNEAESLDFATCPNALWADDYFTSAFLTPQANNSVFIPQNGTIVDLREASATQRLWERVMYSGRRYWDQIKGIFNVSPESEVLDRCRVLGVAHFNVNVSDVLQQSESTEFSRLGDYAGNAITAGSNHKFIRYQAKEHSVIMVFMTVRPQPEYMDQVNKFLFKVSPLDFLIPDLAHVGEQPVYQSEIVANIRDGAEPEVFGWQRRYAEYMFTPSHVHGEFKTSLDYWHLSREFDESDSQGFGPYLNSDFIEITESDDMNRIFAVPDSLDQLRCFVYFDTLISRPLGKFVEYHF